MGSGRETIEARDKAHKRADSGVVVGKGARMRSLIAGCRWKLQEGGFLVMRAACSALELGLARDSGPTPNRSITAKTDKDAAMLDSLEKCSPRVPA